MDKATLSMCSNGHRIPALRRIIRSFRLEEQNVLCVYICGSHLWGTCHMHSDWDVVIVVREAVADKPINAHKGELEAFIIAEADFVVAVKGHSMQVLITLWLPKNCVLKEDLEIRTSFQFEPAALIASLSATKDRDLRVAQKHFTKANPLRGKKVLFHLLCYVQLANQLKQLGNMADYTSVKQYRECTVEYEAATSWEETFTAVQPVLDRLWTALTSQF